MKTQSPSIFTLCLLAIYGTVGAVLLAPAIPAIGVDFHLSAGQAQHVMSIYLIGFALGQLLYGPLANRYGRKPAIYMGIGLSMAGLALCLIAALSQQFLCLELGRLVVALGASVGLKMGFTLTSEVYSKEAANRVVAYIITSIALAPALGASLGGFLTQHVAWEATLAVMFLYGIMLVVLCKRFAETAKVLDKQAMQPSKVVKNYMTKLKNPTLVFASLLQGCCPTMAYLFSTLSPFIAMGMLHLSPDQFGLWSILPPIGMILGSRIALHLSTRQSRAETMLWGIGVMSLGAMLMLISLLTNPSVLALFLSGALVYLGLSLLFANASLLALDSATDKSNASAVRSFISMGTAAVGVLLVGCLSLHGYLLPLSMLCTMGFALLCYFRLYPLSLGWEGV